MVFKKKVKFWFVSPADRHTIKGFPTLKEATALRDALDKLFKPSHPTIIHKKEEEGK